MNTSIVTNTLIALAMTLAASLALTADSQAADAATGTASAKPAVASSAAKAKLVDINSAKKDELKTLPGVTDEVAQKIIAGRPYLSKAHLLTRKIVTADAYENLRTQVIAKQKQIPAPKPASK